jgi:hypothetical protein
MNDQRSMSHHHLAIALVVLFVGSESASAQTDAPQETVIDALRAERETLQGRLPDTAHAMTDVDYQVSNLWFAAKHRNWPLANYYLGEVSSHLSWTVRIRPVRRLTNGVDLDLQPILKGIEATSLADIKTAVSQQNTRSFAVAYRNLMTQCYGCHVAAEKPFLRLRIPESPATRMIQMDRTASQP